MQYKTKHSTTITFKVLPQSMQPYVKCVLIQLKLRRTHGARISVRSGRRRGCHTHPAASVTWTTLALALAPACLPHRLTLTHGASHTRVTTTPARTAPSWPPATPPRPSLVRPSSAAHLLCATHICPCFYRARSPRPPRGPPPCVCCSWLSPRKAVS